MLKMVVLIVLLLGLVQPVMAEGYSESIEARMARYLDPTYVTMTAEDNRVRVSVEAPWWGGVGGSWYGHVYKVDTSQYENWDDLNKRWIEDSWRTDIKLANEGMPVGRLFIPSSSVFDWFDISHYMGLGFELINPEATDATQEFVFEKEGVYVVHMYTPWVVMPDFLQSEGVRENRRRDSKLIQDWPYALEGFRTALMLNILDGVTDVLSIVLRGGADEIGSLEMHAQDLAESLQVGMHTLEAHMRDYDASLAMQSSVYLDVVLDTTKHFLESVSKYALGKGLIDLGERLSSALASMLNIGGTISAAGNIGFRLGALRDYTPWEGSVLIVKGSNPIDWKTFYISGRVTDPAGTPISEVTMNFTGEDYCFEPYQTWEDGWWREWGLTGQSITIQPEKDGYTFEPQSITLEGTQENVNFVGRKEDQEHVETFCDGFDSRWNFTGDAPWIIDTSEAYVGGQSARSGAISHNQTTGMRRSVTLSEDSSVSFALRVSSEKDYDFLEFYIDGQQVDRWSGNEPWKTVKYNLPSGTRELEWRYTKDGCTSEGADSAWVDDIRIVKLGEEDYKYSEKGENYLLYGSFGITKDNFDGNADWSEKVNNIFGHEYRVADWNDLVNYHEDGKDIANLFDALKIKNEEGYSRSVSVTRNGDKNYSSTRYYFASRHDHDLPSGWLAHDNIDNYLVSLGSWRGERRILAIRE